MLTLMRRMVADHGNLKRKVSKYWLVNLLPSCVWNIILPRECHLLPVVGWLCCISFHLYHLHLFYYPLLHHFSFKTQNLTFFINHFRLSLFLYPPDSFHGFLDIALISFYLCFLVSLFINFVSCPHAVDWAGYLSVFTHDSIYAIAHICHANSVHPSVCLSVCHTRVLYQNGWTYHRNSFTVW